MVTARAVSRRELVRVLRRRRCDWCARRLSWWHIGAACHRCTDHLALGVPSAPCAMGAEVAVDDVETVALALAEVLHPHHLELLPDDLRAANNLLTGRRDA